MDNIFSKISFLGYVLLYGMIGGVIEAWFTSSPVILGPIVGLILGFVFMRWIYNRIEWSPGCFFSGVGIFSLFTVLVMGFLYVNNQLSGCTNELRDRFTNSAIASQYKVAYISQLVKEHPMYGGTKASWSYKIEAVSTGCSVEFTALYGTTKYSGDKFIIDPKTNLVKEGTSGAKIFFQYYTGSHYFQ